MERDNTHLDILKEGIPTWNRFMQEGGYKIKANFQGAHLRGMDLRQAVMNEANFWGADLTGALMSGGTFQRATFNDAILSEVEAVDAKFSDSNLVRSRFDGANLRSAHFGGANLSSTDFSGADLRDANLMFAFVSYTNMKGAALESARMHGCLIQNSDLSHTKLHAADLTLARLVQSNLDYADLTSCCVYGISVWDVSTKDTKQANLQIIRDSEPVIQVDNLSLAQFIYLLLDNKTIRHVIDTITSKAVLILGRFTADRKVILDAIRDELRKRDYTPVLFDFDKPSSRDITETVSTLAHMARFVIADITDAKSIPQELMAIVPTLPSVPVQPLLLASQREYGMFEHFRRFPWVLEPYLYDDQEQLLAALTQKVIEPAEKKVNEQRDR